MEEADERPFLFGGKHGANAHYFALGAAGVYEDLFGAFYRLERHGQPLRRARGDNCCGVLATLDLALVGTLEGGADGDDPVWTRHLQF